MRVEPYLLFNGRCEEALADGKVPVESAKLAEMQDYIQINSGHTFIMRNKGAIEQVIHFLQHRLFDRKP